jgi:mono/diheme cytochrome c family protein
MPIATALATSLVVLAGCPDELQDQEGHLPHERPLLSVPAGVVPTDIAPSSPHRLEPAATQAEAEQLTNPFRASAGAIAKGRVAYQRYCSHCHGSLGRGWTSVGSSFDPAPPDLVTAAGGKTDGELFGIVTFGRNLSPALGATVSVEDRWRTILFLRTLDDRRRDVEPRWGQ